MKRTWNFAFTVEMGEQLVGSRLIPSKSLHIFRGDDGQWAFCFHGFYEPILEPNLIAFSKRATNWEAIKETHFPKLTFNVGDQNEA